MKALHISEALRSHDLRRLTSCPVEELPVSEAAADILHRPSWKPDPRAEQREGAEREFSLAPRRRREINERGDGGDNQVTFDLILLSSNARQP